MYGFEGTVSMVTNFCSAERASADNKLCCHVLTQSFVYTCQGRSCYSMLTLTARALVEEFLLVSWCMLLFRILAAFRKSLGRS